jgi:hypothetical protein
LDYEPPDLIGRRPFAITTVLQKKDRLGDIEMSASVRAPFAFPLDGKVECQSTSTPVVSRFFVR